jgi:hypothetical protein
MTPNEHNMLAFIFTYFAINFIIGVVRLVSPRKEEK